MLKFAIFSTVLLSVCSSVASEKIYFLIESVCVAENNRANVLIIKGYAPSIPVEGNPSLDKILNSSTGVKHFPHYSHIEGDSIAVIAETNIHEDRWMLLASFIVFVKTELVPENIVRVNSDEYKELKACE